MKATKIILNAKWIIYKKNIFNAFFRGTKQNQREEEGVGHKNSKNMTLQKHNINIRNSIKINTYVIKRDFFICLSEQIQCI